MKLQHTIEGEERIEISIERNWFTGAIACFENGNKHWIQSPWNPATHLKWKLSQEYEFEVGESQEYRITIIHSRPGWFAGLRPQTFELFLNGKLLETYTGY